MKGVVLSAVYSSESGVGFNSEENGVGEIGV